MKIALDSLLGQHDYAAWRRTHHRRALAHRRCRTVPLGPSMRLMFEDEMTLRYQIQEVLRIERTEDPAHRQHEIEAYSHLLPNGQDWRATLQIELPDAQQRERELPPLSRATHEVYVEVARQRRVYAQANTDLPDRHLTRPSAVHFLRFELPADARAAIAAGAPVSVGCANHAYDWRRLIPPATLAALRVDLEPPRSLALRGSRCGPAEPDPRTPWVETFVASGVS